ncbi:MAG: hypothetical protein QW303_09220 [Nitrososphaerota archaeon]
MNKNEQEIEEFIKLCKIENGVLVSPTIYTKNKSGKTLFWKIYVCLVFMETDEILPINQKYIKRGKLPEGTNGAFWTESGIEGGITRKSDLTYTREKNIGRQNYTTSFTQAILEAYSEYKYRIQKGGVTNKKNLLSQESTLEDLIKAGKWRVAPMLLHNATDNWDKVKFPLYIQPKYDGVLFIVLYHPDLPNKIDGYSRGRKEYKQDHILEELKPILQKYPGLYLVGELYKHGISLQEISGFSRRQYHYEETVKLDYYIFDCFRIAVKQPFHKRFSWLKKINIKGEYLKLTPTFEVKNKEEMFEKYNEFINEGYEGAVIRNYDSPYEYGVSREIRSYYTLKLKPREDDEYPVVDFKEGVRGKEIGAIIWICAENDKGVKLRTGKKIPLEERLTFAVTPNMSYENRYYIYKKLKSEPQLFKKIYGKDYTIEYFSLSNNYIPQQPKGKRFRDQKLNELLLS